MAQYRGGSRKEGELEALTPTDDEVWEKRDKTWSWWCRELGVGVHWFRRTMKERGWVRRSTGTPGLLEAAPCRECGESRALGELDESRLCEECGGGGGVEAEPPDTWKPRTRRAVPGYDGSNRGPGVWDLQYPYIDPTVDPYDLSSFTADMRREALRLSSEEDGLVEEALEALLEIRRLKRLGEGLNGVVKPMELVEERGAELGIGWKRQAKLLELVVLLAREAGETFRIRHTRGKTREAA